MLSFLDSSKGLNAGVMAGFGECLAFTKARVVIELKELYGGFADEVRRVDANAVQLKAQTPAIRAGMKYSQELRWVTNEGTEVAAFGVIAGGAGPGKVA